MCTDFSEPPLRSVETMMGRLKTWIDRVRSAPSAPRGIACAGRRRRLLAFEQFESRLVMSAAVQSTWAAGDDVPVADALLHDLWTITPGSAQWGDVTFAVTRSDASADASFAFPLRINAEVGTSKLANTFRLDEGGLIELSPMLSGDVSASFSSNVSPWLLSYAFDGNLGISRGTAVSGLATNVLAGDRFDLYVDGNNVDITVSGDLGATDGSAELFGESDLDVASEPAQNSIASAVLRITSPLLIEDAEGGAIDVTAIVAPRAALAAEFTSRVASNADVRVDDSLRLASSSAQRAALVGAAGDADGLRARAIVFEVALGGDAGGDADERARADRSPATPEGPSAPAPRARRGDQDTTQSTPARAAAVAGGAEAVDAQVDSASADQVSAAEGAAATGVASKGRAAALDAALGQLGGLPDPRLAVGIDVTTTRQQAAGLAFALVAGATPLIKLKRARHARVTRLAEQSSGRS
jgi:hypothetical protein